MEAESINLATPTSSIESFWTKSMMHQESSAELSLEIRFGVETVPSMELSSSELLSSA